MATVAAAAALLSSSVAVPLSSSISPVSAQSDPGTGACVNGWQELVVPGGQFRSVPFEVLTRDGDLGWVIGASDEGIAAMRWADGRLQRVGAGPSGRRGFVGGIATGRRTVLGVGFFRPKVRRLKELAGRIVAGRWAGQPISKQAGSEAVLSEVVRLASGTLWAAGTSQRSGHSRGIVLRRKGGSWRRLDPRGSARDSGFLGLARSPGGAIWAVGWRATRGGHLRPHIARRRAGRWSTMRGAGLPAGSAVLTDVAFRDGVGGWAVGHLVRAGSAFHLPILERWIGGAWRRVALPWAENASSLPSSLALGPDGRIWIAGTQLATGAREARGFIAHGRGDEWTVNILETPDDVRSDLRSVAVTGRAAFAAGNVGGTAIVVRSCEAPGVAAGGRRIRVGRMRRRRSAPDRHPAGEATPVIADVDSPGPSVRLAPPSAPQGFRLRDVAAEAGIAMRTMTYGALTTDLDGDGWTDVLVSRHYEDRPLLALGGPNGFSVAGTHAFSAIDRHGCDAADVDGDDRRDVLCLVGRARGSSINRHELSLAAAYSRGEVSQGALGLSDPLGRGRAVAFVRLDGDRYPEVFVVNQPEREDARVSPNRFFRNVEGRFVPAPEVGLDGLVGGACIQAVDVDGDGDQDLLHCQSHPDDGRPPGLRIHRNQGVTFVERSRLLGVRPIGDLDVAMADVDGDGRRDLIQLSHDSLRISRRTSSGFRRIYQARITLAAAVATGDVNGDGRPDIYVVRQGREPNRPDRLLVNDGDGRSFTSVAIPQTSEGTGDDVVSLDYDRNGLADFLVLNGRGSARGPIQLLASSPPGP